LALQSTQQAVADGLEEIFGSEWREGFRSCGALLIAEGAEAVRLLLPLFGGDPAEVWRLFRTDASGGFVAFGAERKSVTWRPRHQWRSPRGLFVSLVTYAYEGVCPPLTLHLAATLDAVEFEVAPDFEGDIESFRSAWKTAAHGTEHLGPEVLGPQLLPGLSCPCGNPVVRLSELQRLMDNLPVCPTCQARMDRWERQAEAEEQRRRMEKAKAKARQEQKGKQHHGSSAKPYSQKRR